LMLPHLVLRDFLDVSTVAGLLDHALSRQSQFEATRLGSGAVDPAFRVSIGLRELGGYRQGLKRKVFDLLPPVVSRLRLGACESPPLETQLVAHGDGAFYKRHIDTQTGRHVEVERIRVVSGVYYFHAEPKAFTGGALRLHAIFGQDARNFIDIEPTHNS